jgi:TRAP-type C4-dicarboxylate transport system permease small subunit
VRRTAARIAAAIDRACDAGAWLAVLCCALLGAMLIAESFATAVLGWSQPWAVEYSAYLAATTLFAGSGYTLRHGAHIRVAAVLASLPRGLARSLDAGCTAFAFGIACFAASGLTELAFRSATLNSVSYFTMQTPLAAPQAVLAASFWLLAAALLARGLRLLADVPLVDEAAHPAEL